MGRMPAMHTRDVRCSTDVQTDEAEIMAKQSSLARCVDFASAPPPQPVRMFFFLGFVGRSGITCRAIASQKEPCHDPPRATEQVWTE